MIAIAHANYLLHSELALALDMTGVRTHGPRPQRWSEPDSGSQLGRCDVIEWRVGWRKAKV